MNKKILAALAASAVLGAAVAGATPQTQFQQGETQIDLGAGKVKASSNYGDTGSKWNFNGGVTHAFTDKLALQYDYHGLNVKDANGREHEVNLVYSLNKNFAAYAGWNRIDSDLMDHANNVAQLGIIGKAPITDNLDLYGKVALGTRKTTIWEAGLGYSITKDLDINAGYRSVNTKLDEDDNVTFKGFVAGLSYRFGGSHEEAAAPAEAYTPVAQAPVETAPVYQAPAEKKDYYLQSVYFDTDSSAIKSSETAKLDAVVQTAKAYPNDTLKVIGNTDSDASAAYNMALSQRRVQSVEQYVADRGVSSSRMAAVYNGETKPVDSNATAGGKAENRRVDVYINR